MAFLRTLVIALTIPVKIMSLCFCPEQIFCHQLKPASHNTTNYAPYLRQHHGEKSSFLVEMNISALRLNPQIIGLLGLFKYGKK